jgi:hypothetical protein
VPQYPGHHHARRADAVLSTSGTRSRTPAGVRAEERQGADFHHDKVDKAPDTPTFVLDSVDDFTVTTGRPVSDVHLDHVDYKEL